MDCCIQGKFHIKINNTILILGLIVEAFLDQDFLMKGGFIDLEKAGRVTVSGTWIPIMKRYD